MAAAKRPASALRASACGAATLGTVSSEKGLARGHVKDIQTASREREGNDLPKLNVAATDDPAKDSHEESCQASNGQKLPRPIGAVSNCARDEAQQERR